MHNVVGHRRRGAGGRDGICCTRSRPIGVCVAQSAAIIGGGCVRGPVGAATAIAILVAAAAHGALCVGSQHLTTASIELAPGVLALSKVLACLERCERRWRDPRRRRRLERWRRGRSEPLAECVSRLPSLRVLCLCSCRAHSFRSEPRVAIVTTATRATARTPTMVGMTATPPPPAATRTTRTSTWNCCNCATLRGGRCCCQRVLCSPLTHRTRAMPADTAARIVCATHCVWGALLLAQ
ncbi:hypothetical protein PybrP1_003060 [[Pythium] brassicae (nom. inval.)]|nr:hypothetical protein PybrP1_003060 [[Pythium] brassicae (nom. inval.)]